MKKYFQYLALAVGALVLSSCGAENFDDEDYAPYNYPTEARIDGAWADTTLASGVETGLELTRTAAGDTVVNVTMSVPGEIIHSSYAGRTLVFQAVGGKITSYSAKAGAYTVEFSNFSSWPGQLLGATIEQFVAYLTYNKESNKLQGDLNFIFNGRLYSLNDNLGFGNFTVEKSKLPLRADGYYSSTDGAIQIQLGQSAIWEDPSAIILAGADAQPENGEWSYDATTGKVTVTTTGGKTYTATFNEQGQLVFDNNGTAVILDKAI